MRWIAREAIERGYQVTLATSSSCLTHTLYLAMQRDCDEQIRISLLPEVSNASRLGGWLDRYESIHLIRRELKYHRLFSRYFSSFDEGQLPDFVFVPYLDYCAHAAGLLGSPFGTTPWGGITLRAAFHFHKVGVKRSASKLDAVKRNLLYNALRGKSLQKMFTIDETLPPTVAEDKRALANKLEYAPDPVRIYEVGSRLCARKTFGISADSVVLLVYGALSARKGIGTLLEAMRHPDFPEDVEILLAGSQHTEIKTLLSSPFAVEMRQAGRIHEFDGVLDDKEEHMAFLASDLVWLGYQNHYMMSGVLLQAGAMSLPVLACEEGLIGYLTRKHELGLSVDIENPPFVAVAVRRLVENASLSKALGEKGHIFAQEHTRENFARTIVQGLFG